MCVSLFGKKEIKFVKECRVGFHDVFFGKKAYPMGFPKFSGLASSHGQLIKTDLNQDIGKILIFPIFCHGECMYKSWYQSLENLYF